MIEYTAEISKEKSQEISVTFAKVADFLDLKPGVKIPLEEAAKAASKMLLAPGQKPTVHGMLFDCIDTNSNGILSKEEFSVYFKVIGHDTA